MKTAIIHAGLHKTGTTSIQSSLANYKDKDTAYADLGRSNHSIVFKTLFHPSNLFNYWANLGLSAAEHRELVDQYRLKLNEQLQQEQSRIVFSGEEISALEPEALARMKSHFEEQGRDSEIFVFVREPLGMTASVIQELAKWGSLLHNESTDHKAIDYRLSERVGNLLDIFGKETTHICYYEDALSSKYPRGVIDYFAELLGIQPESLPSVHTTNQSIGETTFKLLNQFFQTDIVHNKGPMLQAARWSFIRMLNDAVETGNGNKINLNAVRAKVNWDDYAKLNSLLTRPYELDDHQASATEPFSKYCSDIDDAEVCRNLTNYFKRHMIPAPAHCNTHELVSLLFYQALQEHAAKQTQASMAEAQKQAQRNKDRFNAPKKVAHLLKRLKRKLQPNPSGT